MKKPSGELGQSPGAGEGQGSLAYCSLQDCKQLDTTWQLNNNNSGGKPTGKHAFSYTHGGNVNLDTFKKGNFIICNNYISIIFLMGIFTCMHDQYLL